jgi:hypothetical protein
MADIRRDGYCLLSYEEIRTAWPGEFGSAAQAALMALLARDSHCEHTYQEQGVLFRPAAAE